MKLYMLRHGEAGHAVSGTDDSRRPLTEQGIEKLGRQAHKMVKWKIRFDRILSSPYTRAFQTAEIVGKAFDLKVQPDPRLRSGAFNLSQLAALLADHDSRQNLLVVGHEPDFSTVLGQLIGGGRISFVKGGFACVELYSLLPPAGELIFFATPEMQGA